VLHSGIALAGVFLAAPLIHCLKHGLKQAARRFDPQVAPQCPPFAHKQ
jgi:hypothetical protein